MGDKLRLLFIIFITMFLFGSILTLFHELGHAVFALIFTDDDIDIIIGKSENKIGNLKLKRINICFNNLITYYGMCYWGKIKKESNIKFIDFFWRTSS